jgi:hypothetical protein
MWPTSVTNLGQSKYWLASQTPSLLKFNGLLYMAWVSSAPAEPGKYYIALATTSDGVEWNGHNLLWMDSAGPNVGAWAVSTGQVTLANWKESLYVFYNSLDAPKTYFTKVAPVEGVDGPLGAATVPNWDFGKPCAIATDLDRQFVFSWAGKGDIWVTSRGHDDVWSDKVNVGEKAGIFTKVSPTTIVIPGYPSSSSTQGKPWRIWLHVVGGDNDTGIWEHTYSI